MINPSKIILAIFLIQIHLSKRIPKQEPAKPFARENNSCHNLDKIVDGLKSSHENVSIDLNDFECTVKVELFDKKSGKSKKYVPMMKKSYELSFKGC